MVRVLTFVEFYLPGYTAGGPIRTIANLVDQLGDRLDFKLITRDADPRDPRPYADVVRDAFQQIGKAKVFYATPGRLSFASLRRLIGETPHDVLYLNSFSSPDFTIKPLLLRRFGLLPDVPVVVASRGEFSEKALAIKPLKKRSYLAFAKALGLYEGVTWQASSAYEREDIYRQFGADSRVVIASNLPEVVPARPVHSDKRLGALKLLFLARIARMKNVDGALRMLEGVEAPITFDIYGPMEDEALWAECLRLIERLPPGIQVQYRGHLLHHQVREVMAEYDLLFFPTHGENYGHVIAEALSAGCPVLVSDRTPWRGLEAKQAGWDVPLEDVERFRSILRRCVAMNAEAHVAWRRGALAHAREVMHDPQAVAKNYELFVRAATRAR